MTLKSVEKKVENQLNADSSDVFKILSIDGGGFRGLFSSTVLSEFERINSSISTHFDMLCGTSTGGLIALALAAGCSSQEVVEFYKTWGPKIFPKPSLYRKLKRKISPTIAPNSRNTNKALTQAIQTIVGDNKMSDSNSYLCIPTLSLIDYSPFVFKTDHDPFLTRDSDALMKDVGLATSAAPFYFPATTAIHLPGSQFLDGGLWANNPSLVGLIEAGRFFVGKDKPYKKVQILSISSLSPAAGRMKSEKCELSLLTSGGDVFTATLESQQKATEHFIKFLIPSLNFEVEYVRVPCPQVAIDHCEFIGLDIADKKAVELLEFYGRKIGNEWNTKPEIQSFFTQKALPPKFRSDFVKGENVNV